MIENKIETNNHIKSKKKFDHPVIIAAIIALIGVVSGALIQGYFSIISIREKKEKYEFWSVTGKLGLKDKQEFDVKNVIMSIKPPEQDLYRSGIFVIQKVPIKPDEKRMPSLLIKKAGYKITEVILEVKTHKYYEGLGLCDYSIKYDDKNKMIEIEEPIILEKEEIIN